MNARVALDALADKGHSYQHVVRQLVFHILKGEYDDCEQFDSWPAFRSDFDGFTNLCMLAAYYHLSGRKSESLRNFIAKDQNAQCINNFLNQTSVIAQSDGWKWSAFCGLVGSVRLTFSSKQYLIYQCTTKMSSISASCDINDPATRVSHREHLSQALCVLSKLLEVYKATNFFMTTIICRC